MASAQVEMEVEVAGVKFNAEEMAALETMMISMMLMIMLIILMMARAGVLQYRAGVGCCRS